MGIQETKFDEEQYQAEEMVRGAIMDDPKTKRVVQQVKKDLKKQKRALKKKIMKRTKG